MTTREEIREGIDTSIQFAITAAYLAGKTGEDLGETKEKCTTYLKDALHSQGVVVKVAYSRSPNQEYPVAVEPLINDN